MRELFACANQYVRESDWKDLALVKFCLCAMGIMIGLCVPREKKKYPFLMAGLIFIVTYIPLIVKFSRIVWKSFCQEKNQG